MKKNKEHKKGESTIGKIIYGFLLFMPLFAIGVTCGYAMFNKNAYKSFSSRYVNQSLQTNQETLVSNDTYVIVQDESVSVTGTQRSYYYGFDNISYDITNIDNYERFNYFGFLYYSNGIVIFTLYETTDYRTQYNVATYNDISLVPQITFVSDGNVFKESSFSNHFTLYVNSYVQEKIDNVFYYAVDKVTESPLFSWATNSVIYTTMNATCTQLSITAPFIPLLLSYWLIISVIYFLYDIALMLIWLLHDKIHEMRDSLA